MSLNLGHKACSCSYLVRSHEQHTVTCAQGSILAAANPTRVALARSWSGLTLQCTARQTSSPTSKQQTMIALLAFQAQGSQSASMWLWPQSSLEIRNCSALCYVCFS